MPKTLSPRPLDRDDLLDDFDHRDVVLLGSTHRVYVMGSGPAVVLMAEVPGINPYVTRFARWARDAGFTIYMPHIFSGRDGAQFRKSRVLLSMFHSSCISRQFRAFQSNESSPATQWLRSLAALAHQECGGRGVGAIGMCLTGNFALTMMLEPSVLAPVMCQPALPLNHPAGMHIAPRELAAVKARMEVEDLTVLAYRFEGDKLCTAARFAAYEAALGDRFVGRVLPDSAANPDSPMRNPHSVVTTHLIDEEGEPTIRARDEILDFFKKRLKG